mgnify:CR=1 FL=1
MENDFFELSKNVANKFIQSVVFIDDKAYELGVRENAFDAQVVSNEFATTGKVCAIYAPKKESDINNYYPILDKADVIILDWRLDLEKDVKTDLNPEDDAEVDDARGEYTIKIIITVHEEEGFGASYLPKINELLAGSKAEAFNALPSWQEKYEFIKNPVVAISRMKKNNDITNQICHIVNLLKE